VVIAETVVPYDDRELLSLYVKQQLDASDVMSETQKEAVLTMVNLAPMEAVVNKEEIGEKGSLRNSAVLALIKTHAKNVHFMLIGVRAEPRLGWNWIPSSERNAWNDVCPESCLRRSEWRPRTTYGNATGILWTSPT